MGLEMKSLNRVLGASSGDATPFQGWRGGGANLGCKGPGMRF